MVALVWSELLQYYSLVAKMLSHWSKVYRFESFNMLILSFKKSSVGDPDSLGPVMFGFPDLNPLHFFTNQI